jgi:hypothetical protein
MTPALLTLLLFVAVLLAQQGPAQAFSTSLSRFAQKHALGRPHLEIMARETSLSMAEASPSKAGGAEPFKKFACRSCSYVYDEEKGFKKRYPPGMCVYVIQCTVTPLPPLLQIRNEAHASLSTHLPISPSLHLPIPPSRPGLSSLLLRHAVLLAQGLHVPSVRGSHRPVRPSDGGGIVTVTVTV